MKPAKPVRVLVTDDNPAFRYVTVRTLSAAGFEVMEASTGGAALQLCERELPDVVVLDVQLPDIDGFEVCRRLRNMPHAERLSVIHVSATFLGDEARVRGLESGADAYLTHPVEPLVLIATTRAMLRARDAETARRRSEAELRAIFDRVPVGICVLDERLAYIDANPGLCSMLGRSHDELTGTSVVSSVAGEHVARAGEIESAIQREGEWHGLLSHRTPQGTLVQLDWRISQHVLPNMRLALVTDVTERRRIEQERERLLASERAARGEAERANRLKDEFLAALSHELRTPLNAIVGWAHVLQASNREPADVARGLEIIERNARLQAQLISDLLDVSRIISGKLTLDCEPVVLPDMIDAALEGVEPVASAKDIRIERDFAPLVEPIQGDPARLQQVVWNLVHNAVKFTPRGGKVHIVLRRAGDWATIEIVDNGIGIRPEFLPHIFERFRQEHARDASSHGGLGLGLAIVKQLVSMHGGTITAKSEGLDRGATFTVSLPLVKPGAANGGSAPVVAPRGTRVRVDLSHVRGLVVDDDADARALVCRLLRDRGAQVAHACDVREAIDVMERFDPNVLISDIGMPLQDGYDLIRLVRRRAQHLPAIALTAYARPEDKVRALSFGFQLHVAKPIDADALIEAVANLARH